MKLNIRIEQDRNDYQIFVDDILVGNAGRQLYGYYGKIIYPDGHMLSLKYNTILESIFSILTEHFKSKNIEFKSEYWVSV